jgi:hypothetical protein
VSPYLLPEGNVQIAFSGGRTSAYMLHRIAEANGGLPDRVRVVFANTGRERPQTLDFVSEVTRRWGIDIAWVEYAIGHNTGRPAVRVVTEKTASRNGEPFDALIAHEGALPNASWKFCTRQLKTLTARRWLVSQGWRRWTKAIGIRKDEPSRHAPTPQPRETIWHPLVAAGVGKHDVAAFWKRQPFDLRLPIIRGKTIGGNCDDCFLKSEWEKAAVARDESPIHEWWARHERQLGCTFHKDYSLDALKKRVERQGDWVFDDLGGDSALCQANEGECAA